MVKKNWNRADIPPQNGKLIIVTGGTGGLGYETSLSLAQAGATVILAGRNGDKGKDALNKIRTSFPSANVEFEQVDLASLNSISEFATRVSSKYEKLDVLINNAGIMAPPKREVTQDGYEVQFATNYLSHFALTARLLPLLQKSMGSRVVNLSSVAHRQGKINFKDLQWEKGAYNYDVYCQTKLAMLIFAIELQKRSVENNWGIASIGSHPGFARTDIITNGPGDGGMFYKFLNWTRPFLSHSAAEGALPTLFAATSPEAEGGGYYGPGGFQELTGPVSQSYVVPKARDRDVAAKLWDISVSLTRVIWP